MNAITPTITITINAKTPPMTAPIKMPFVESAAPTTVVDPMLEVVMMLLLLLLLVMLLVVLVVVCFGVSEKVGC
jgi:hypothetical protein